MHSEAEENKVHIEDRSGSHDPDMRRSLDPNILQKQASEPFSSVWVSASAGTGKTKVLADRVLRLLLPREDGQPGTRAHKVLCLTFTKAGASEMALRIARILSRWAVLPLEGVQDTGSKPQSLREELHALLGREARENEVEAARRLFAEVIDEPGGLNIMTIHSFCQSVLSRFPLESGLHPGFGVAEDRQIQELLGAACEQILKEAACDKSSLLSDALSNIAGATNEEAFTKLVRSLTGERHQLKKLLQKNFGVEGLYTKSCALLGIQAGKDPQDLLKDACSDMAFDQDSLRKMTRLLSAAKTKTDLENGEILASWLSANVENRMDFFETYKSVFLTQEGTLRKKAAGVDVTKQAPDVPEIFEQEGLRLLALNEAINKTQCAFLTRHLFLLGEKILERYEKLKTDRSVLDFDDLIFKTLDLLSGQSDTQGATNSQWVQYKLDQGLEHILVDEAQDTNPEQWKIIEALCTEFFSGKTVDERTRTIFSVGDEKQSIYSFQRASPEEFSRMHRYFSKKIREAKEQWKTVELNISFRSTKSVLAAVDSVFSSPQARKGLGSLDIKHHAFRRGQAGLVELWPLFENDETTGSEPWSPPVSVEDKISGSAKLANHIAKTIKGWLDTNEILPSRGSPVRPGDVMVLVRTRTAFTHQLTRALKLLNVPVGGVDRMILNEQLAVQDMLACAEFALMPSDDLKLACVLKSPFIGLSEEELYTLAYGRQGSLWSRVKEKGDPALGGYLSSLLKAARQQTPYGFLSSLLQRPCLADPQSGLRAIKGRLGDDALDALDELLGAALSFERDHIPSLQGFLQWQKKGGGDVKRSDSEQANHVRILTVHGSKGLQAPIVILPDTTSVAGNASGQADSRLLWPDKTELEVPLWSPRKSCDYGFYTKEADKLKERLQEEYRRLLYVAMTRAEDRLYIGGVLTRKTLPDGCWYNLVRNGLKELEGVEAFPDGGLCYTNPQIHDPDRSIVSSDSEKGKVECPAWIFQPPPSEPHPPAPLAPSRPSDPEEPALSPLQSVKTGRFRRGNLTHKLLEILPEIPQEKRQKAALAFLRINAADLDIKIQEDIVSETLSLLDHPEFAPLFGPGSLAEVPITGLLPDGRLVSGQVDRLLIEEKDIWIIDYKTNRPPPTDPDKVPPLYKKQLESYGAVLKDIYPDRMIHTALLWTDGAFLMPLDIEEV